MNKKSKIIATRLSELNLTQDDLAESVGISQSAISKLLNGHTKNTTKLLEIAQVLQLSLDDLVDNLGEMSKNNDNMNIQRKKNRQHEYGLDNVTNVIPHEHFIGRVPLLTFDDISNDNYNSMIWPVCNDQCSADTFALQVIDNSMESQLGFPTFPVGCIVFVDKQAIPVPGNFVIVKNKENKAVLFRRLSSDNGRLWLMPINSQYEKVMIDDNYEIVGKVINMSAKF